MNELDIHILVLCVVVFTLLVAVISILFAIIFKQEVKLIKAGANDDKIKAEYDKYNANKKRNKIFNIISIVVEIIILVLLVGMFAFSIYMDSGRDNVVGDIGVLKTVNSPSMATIHTDNKYIKDNNLTNQIDTDDLIVLEKLPSVEDIKLYDIIMYKSRADGRLVLHRVVNIIEAGENGNTEREFVFQGDAVYAPDMQLVTYDDMKGIYRGKKVDRIGSFIRFMHSPAGYLCIVLACVVLIGIPIIESKILKVKNKRLREIGYIKE